MIMSTGEAFDQVSYDDSSTGNANALTSQSPLTSPSEHFQLFASPNWYDSCVMDILSNGIVLAASRNLILYLRIQELEEDEEDLEVHDRRFKLVLVRQLRAHQERISGVAVKPLQNADDNHRFLTCAHDSHVRLWSFETDTCLRELNLATLLSGGAGKTNKATCLVSSPRASTPLALVGMEGGQLVLWNHEADRAAVSSGKQAEKDGHAFHAAWWAPSSTHGNSSGEAGEEYLAVGYKRGNVAVYSLQVGGATGGGLELRPMHRLRAHDDDVLQVSWNPHFNPDQESCPDLATAGRDRAVKLWRLSSRRCIAHLRIPVSGTNANAGAGGNVGGDDGQQKKSWTSLCWSQGGQGELFATTMYGDILVCSWGGDSGNKFQLLTPGSGQRGHNRMIFAVREYPIGRWLISVSQDRQICVWRPPSSISSTSSSIRGSSGGLMCSTPTIGGFVYALDVHPNNPSLMAIGCGDNTIRLWRHTDLRHQPYSVHTLWQGLNGRVTALAWHPVREGLLALGTEDGRVGVLDSIGSSGKTLPRFSHHHHKGQVYRVQWGPLCPPPAGLRSIGPNSDAFMLYSVGNYQLRRHSASNLAREPVDVGQLLPRPGMNTDEELKFSDIAWRSDQMYFAVGLDTGAVLVYACQPLACVANITLHNKCVNGIQWHPGFDLRAFNWLAIATCEHNVSVTDVGPLLGRFEEAVMAKMASAETSETTQLPPTAQLTECMARLSGHGNRIVDLSWSPHEPGLLLSASFDGTAQVWDVRKARDHGLANFRGHHGRVYCCQWSWTDPDLVFTGGEDYFVIGWRPSQQEHALPTRGRRYRIQLPAGVKASSGSTGQGGSKPGATGSRRQHTASGGSSLGDLVPPSVDELKAMLEEKRSDLVTANGGESNESSPHVSVSDKIQSSLASQQQQASHKRKRPGLFANTNTSVPMDIRRKQDDVVELGRRLNKITGISPPPAYLAVFLRSPAAVLDACVEPEVAYQLRTGHVDNYFTLLIWSGQEAKASTEAVRAEYLPDWLMAVLCGAQARELVDEALVVAKARLLVQQQGDSVLAATYLLACDCLPQALALLRDKNMFREAAVLHLLHQGGSNGAMEPDACALSDLYASWAVKEVSHGSYEMAAKAWLAADRVDEALRVLSKRQTLYSFWTLARLCWSYGRQQQAELWLRQLVNRALTEHLSTTSATGSGEENPPGPIGVAQQWHQILMSAAVNGGEDARLLALPSSRLFTTVLDVFIRIRNNEASLIQLLEAVSWSDGAMPDSQKPFVDDGSVRPTTTEWPQAFAYLLFDLAAVLRCNKAEAVDYAPLLEQFQRSLKMCSSVDLQETQTLVKQLIGKDVDKCKEGLMAALITLMRAV